MCRMVDNPAYRTVIAISSANSTALNAAQEFFLNALPSDSLVNADE